MTEICCNNGVLREEPVGTCNRFLSVYFVPFIAFCFATAVPTTSAFVSTEVMRSRRAACPFFGTGHQTLCPVRTTEGRRLNMGYGRNVPRSRERSKRQERVGNLVRSELSKILHQKDHAIKHSDYLENEVRRKISVVNADVSPDLRQARITVSILGKDAVEKRRAYSWLVRSTKMIRHALAQELAYMKSVPNLNFVQADVGAAVDVMQLIDKVSEENYKRPSVGLYGGDADNELPRGMVMGTESDEDEGGEWEGDEEDGGDFEWMDDEE